jgi:hypothetical protein
LTGKVFTTKGEIRDKFRNGVRAVELLRERSTAADADAFHEAAQACRKMESELGHGDFVARVRRAARCFIEPRCGRNDRPQRDLADLEVGRQPFATSTN